ncbi:MAG: hypothetical protein LBQ02_03795 [Candidatus Nomurabacteria bacterium]|jgi:Tfp pilus assembly protein PilX|nr:hypothetical protein [Candidatus Nomurabacteria bacterium]
MKRTKKGAVSLYVVIFATLLLTVITLSFVRIMLKERSQSSNDDISQSAYDSALAGIEDAKLAIMKYNACLSGTDMGASEDDGNPNTANVTCDDVISLMNANAGDDCDIVSNILGRPIKGAPNNQETTIQESNNTGTTTTDEQLDQAYTCVRITNSAEDFLGRLDQTNRSRIIPLRAEKQFNKIVINWTTNVNIADGWDIAKLPVYNANPTTFFPAEWPRNVPPVIETQLIQTSGSFSLTDFDMSDMSANKTNRATAIIVPTQDGDPLTIDFSTFARTSDKLGTDSNYGANGLFTTKCQNANVRYYCTATINLPNPLGTSPKPENARNDNDEVFLRLAHVYANEQSMDYQILLYQDGTPIGFSGVQAVVDSTGRTSDLLRRIESRVELIDVNFPYPEYAVELTGGSSDYALCKSYQITKNNWISGVNNLTECK